MDHAAELALLRDMADAVSERVRNASPERFGDDLGMGADGTSTKLVDDLAEQELLRVLRDRKPGLNFLSEEAGYVDLRGERVLVADPIDGTTNAARGIPFYCVSLAIGRKSLSDVDVGLVANLATGDRYEAIRGAGATFNGRPIRVREVGEELVVGVSGARGGLRGIGRSLGAAALEMSLVASGGLDLYHYPKPLLRVIDVAAATLIVREAGGVVLDAKGQDLDLPLSLVPRFGLTAASGPRAMERAGVAFE